MHPVQGQFPISHVTTWEGGVADTYNSAGRDFYNNTRNLESEVERDARDRDTDYINKKARQERKVGVVKVRSNK